MKSFSTSMFAIGATLAIAATLSTAPDKVEAGTDPFIGDIIAVGTNFCPRGWAAAEGQLLPIASNTALFSLIGTTYGGDGRTTMGLPDLRARHGMGTGSGPGLTPRTIGQKFGSSRVTISEAQLPAHRHLVQANNLDGDKPGPGGKLLAAAPPGGTGSETIYSNEGATVDMSSEMITPTGGGNDMITLDPFVTMRFCIALQGLYPSRP